MRPKTGGLSETIDSEQSESKIASVEDRDDTIHQDLELDRAMEAFTSAISELKIHGLDDYTDGLIPLVEGEVIASGSTALVRDGTVKGKGVAIKTFSYSMDELKENEENSEENTIVNKLVDFVDEARLGFKASQVSRSGRNSYVAATIGVSGRIVREGREVQLILIMEKAKGRDLAEIIHDECYWTQEERTPTPSLRNKYTAVLDDNSVWSYTMPQALKLDLSILLTQAVLQVHRSGVCHCDIKPENIIIEMEYSSTPAALKVSPGTIESPLSHMDVSSSLSFSLPHSPSRSITILYSFFAHYLARSLAHPPTRAWLRVRLLRGPADHRPRAAERVPLRPSAA